MFWIIAIVYFLITSYLYTKDAFFHFSLPRFFYPDIGTVLRIEEAQSQHVSLRSKKLTRFFYNKPFGYMESYVDNIYRSIDMPFLFSLSGMSSMYDNQGPMQMLFPWELLLFIPAALSLIRSRNKKYLWFMYAFLIVIAVSAFFLPSLSKIKLFPEVLLIRFIIICGLYEGGKKWLKK